MSYIYTEEHKLYDKLSEISLINLHGLALRNNNELNLGELNLKSKRDLYIIEIANMIQFINKDIKVYLKAKNKIAFIWFKLKNRHLANIHYTKEENKKIKEELFDIMLYMEKENNVACDIWGKIYDLNFNRKENKK